jgi:parallel beta-helix repeat protein
MQRYKHILIFTVVNFFLSTASQAQQIIVPDDGYDTIQAAIDAVQADPELADTIVVKPGTYRENLTLISNVSLQGREAARTFLESPGNDPVVSIDSLTNVTLRNFTIRDAQTGIQVLNSNNAGNTVRIVNNIFARQTGPGIEILDSSNPEIINNTFFKNDVAINRATANALIQNNILVGNNTAIMTDNDDNTNISFNLFNQNVDNGQIGTDELIGEDPLFVDTDNNDFHLKINSPGIDAGTGTDHFDDSVSDLGAYGGEDADTWPFPVQNLQASKVDNVFSIDITWSPNESYWITTDDENYVNGYKIYYDSDKSGAPYEGKDAGGGDSLFYSPFEIGNVTSYTLANLSPSQTAPEPPVITTITPGDKKLLIEWAGTVNTSGYKLHYGIASADENVIDVNDVTSYELTGLENNVEYKLALSSYQDNIYYIAVSAFFRVFDSDNHQIHSDESALTSEQSVQLADPLESEKSAERTGFPEPVSPYPNLPNEGCFVATAAYGYYSAPEVQVLRDFRDQYLLTNKPGRAFVAWYYTYGPYAAHFITLHPELKPLVRLALQPLIWVAQFLKSTSSLEKTLFVLVTVFIFLLPVGMRYRSNRSA